MGINTGWVLSIIGLLVLLMIVGKYGTSFGSEQNEFKKPLFGLSRSIDETGCLTDYQQKQRYQTGQLLVGVSTRTQAENLIEFLESRKLTWSTENRGSNLLLTSQAQLSNSQLQQLQQQLLPVLTSMETVTQVVPLPTYDSKQPIFRVYFEDFTELADVSTNLEPLQNELSLGQFQFDPSQLLIEVTPRQEKKYQTMFIRDFGVSARLADCKR